MDINEKLKQLDNVLLVFPNRHMDCFIQELDEYKFLADKLEPVNTPLWKQCFNNVTSKIYDLDLSVVVPDVDSLAYEIHDSNFGMDFCYYFLSIDENKYDYIEKPNNHFLKSETELIKTDTLYTAVASAIVMNMELTIEAIKSQLRKIDKKDWIALFDSDNEYRLEQLNYFLNK